MDARGWLWVLEIVSQKANRKLSRKTFEEYG